MSASFCKSSGACRPSRGRACWRAATPPSWRRRGPSPGSAGAPRSCSPWRFSHQCRSIAANSPLLRRHSMLKALMSKVLLASLALFLSAAAALAEEWPAKPITVLMGFPAGSGVDVVARMLQPSLEKSLGQRLVLDYKTGAGGNVASEVVANARPDGYTFLLGTAATHGVNPALYPKLSFDVEADFTPISTLVDVSNVLTINSEVIDAKSVADFNAKAGLDMVHVPYRGGPDAMQAVLKGDVCCIFNQVQTVLQQWRAGKVRLLGVTTRKRVVAIPDIPTIDEAGLPGYESYTWFAIFGPRGLDAAIAQKF